MKRVLIWVGVIASFVGSLWVGWTLRAKNSAQHDLDLIWYQVADVEMWWLLLLSTGFGACLVALVMGFAWLRMRLLMGRYRSRVRRLEKEIHELRSLPLVGSEPGGANLDVRAGGTPLPSQSPAATTAPTRQTPQTAKRS